MKPPFRRATIPLKRWEIQCLCLIAQCGRSPEGEETLKQEGKLMCKAGRQIGYAILHPRKAKVSKAIAETAAVFRRRGAARAASVEARQARRLWWERAEAAFGPAP